MRENPMGVGDKMIAAGVSNSIQPVMNLTQDAGLASNVLQSENMPVLHFWILQTTAIAAPATIQLEGSWRVGPGAVDEFLPLIPAFLTTPGIPQLIVLRQTPTKIRFTATRVAGTATQLRYVLSSAAA